MKTHDIVSAADIRNESELVHHFRQLVDGEVEIHFKAPPESPVRLPWVEIQLDGPTHRLKPVLSLRPSILELESILKDWTDPLPPLLVAPDLTSRILEFCREHRLAAVDLNGRAYVRADGLLIDRGRLPGRDFRFELEPRNVFVGKSVRIIRALLTDRDRLWTQGELVWRSRASSGLVSRIVQHLIGQGFLEKKSPRELRVRDPLGLVDAWARSDAFGSRAVTTRYSTLSGQPLEIARKLAAWASGQSTAIAFTQWIAGWLRHPYTEPVVISAYADRLPEDATLEQLGIRPVSEAGRIWLHIPDDEGVFLETQTVNGLRLVSDAQICVDLQGTGLRGPDQAAALRDWTGFCRP
jgi:hypothetical protein